MNRTLTLKALADAIAVDKAQLSKESRRDGFPKDMVGGVAYFDASEVSAWRAANIKQRKIFAPQIPAASADAIPMQTPATPMFTIPPVPPKNQLADEDDEFVKRLISGNATPIDMLEASLQLAARHVGKMAVAGAITTQALDGLNKSAEELRRSKDAELELAKKRAELLDRETMMSIAGTMAARLNTCCATIVNDLPVQIELWFTDADFRGSDIQARKRTMRAFLENKFNEVRRLEADTIAGMIKAAVIEEQPA